MFTGERRGGPGHVLEGGKVICGFFGVLEKSTQGCKVEKVIDEDWYCQEQWTDMRKEQRRRDIFLSFYKIICNPTLT